MLMCVLMMAYEDAIVTYSEHNNDDDDDDMEYVAENDIEMMMTDDQAMVVGNGLVLLVLDLILYDEMVMLVNVLIRTRNIDYKM